ncbi:hypothetical protein B9G98_02783 [Wickerhamiella sorbophila]|uniref:DASH complex subunit DAM1 n=1 Tax=Wickerhamiella sorbophila TaxID=45607 RepID=A0A2T0FJI8_9ASCO|nr:hypothetical protein B9G98_02783 [Wickerhamiella sorbophila]PRT55163.1 hypothetical protein B9G98_02783 [Wickerhamiella sorbophila]
MLHLDEAFAGHIDAIQGQLQKLDRTVGDLSQVQNSAVVNTEQFSRILYGLYVVTAAVKFPQAPDSLALKQATEPSAKTALVPTQATLPPQPRVETPRYKPMSPQESIMRFSSTTRIQKPTPIKTMRSFYMPVTTNYRG